MQFSAKSSYKYEKNEVKIFEMFGDKTQLGRQALVKKAGIALGSGHTTLINGSIGLHGKRT